MYEITDCQLSTFENMLQICRLWTRARTWFFSHLTSVYTLNFCKKVISCHFLIPKRPLCYIVLYQKVEPRKDLSNVYQDTWESACFNSHLNSCNPTISQHIQLIFFDGLRIFENTISSNQCKIKKGFDPIALMGISKKKERPKETMKLRMR